jgi:hypothetical protein
VNGISKFICFIMPEAATFFAHELDGITRTEAATG